MLNNILRGNSFMLTFECLHNNHIGVSVGGDAATRVLRLPTARQRLDSVPPGVGRARSPRQKAAATLLYQAMLLSGFLLLLILNIAAAVRALDPRDSACTAPVGRTRHPLC